MAQSLLGLQGVTSGDQSKGATVRRSPWSVTSTWACRRATARDNSARTVQGIRLACSKRRENSHGPNDAPCGVRSRRLRGVAALRVVEQVAQLVGDVFVVQRWGVAVLPQGRRRLGMA